jgi:hypothetical protein
MRRVEFSLSLNYSTLELSKLLKVNDSIGNIVEFFLMICRRKGSPKVETHRKWLFINGHQVLITSKAVGSMNNVTTQYPPIFRAPEDIYQHSDTSSYRYGLWK